MIDRIELKTSQYGHFIESRNKHIPKGVSQLLAEDQDIIELKRSDLNPLYRNSIIHTVMMQNGKPTDDPVKFYIFSDPRFNRNMTDRYKIVFNPNKTTIGEALQFLQMNFNNPHRTNDETFFDDFKIGRIDFNADITTHTVKEIQRILFFDRKVQLHTTHTDGEIDGIDPNAVRIIGRKDAETIYIGKGMYMLRVYNKVKEAQSRIATLKANDMPVPAALEKLAAQPLVTRLEFQIRDLYRSGIQKVDAQTGEMNRFRPRKGIHYVRTFNDLIRIRRDQFDVFSELKFKTEKLLSMAKPTTRRSAKQRFLGTPWVVDAFNALAENVGLDQAMKKLDPDTRRTLKGRIFEKKFLHDLNEICFNEIKHWLSN